MWLWGQSSKQINYFRLYATIFNKGPLEGRQTLNEALYGMDSNRWTFRLPILTISNHTIYASVFCNKNMQIKGILYKIVIKKCWQMFFIERIKSSLIKAKFYEKEANENDLHSWSSWGNLPKYYEIIVNIKILIKVNRKSLQSLSKLYLTNK